MVKFPSSTRSALFVVYNENYCNQLCSTVVSGKKEGIKEEVNHVYSKRLGCIGYLQECLF